MTTDQSHRPGVVDLAAARAARELPPVPPPPPPATLVADVVDPEPYAPKVPARTPRPILPEWARDKETITATARWGARYAGHVTAFHLLRLPLYALRLAARSPVGIGRLLAAAWRWLFNLETRDVQLRALAAATAEPKVYVKLVDAQRGQMKARLIVVAVVLVVVLVATLAVVNVLPAAWQAVVVLTLVLLLGVIGRKADTRVTGRAMDTAEVPPLTAGLITSALSNLGVAAINSALKNDERAISFVLIVRDGPGFRADIDLPAGVTAGEVIERRSKLASGLRRPVGCVWPEADPDVHEGRLQLYVADQSLAEATQRPWPLAKTGSVNIFRPIPIGTDQRGRLVEITLMYASGLIGAVPRMGKTMTLRLLLLAASLDPRVEIHAYNLKGGADLDPIEPVAHAYRTGDDPDDLAFMLRDLRQLQDEMRRRYTALRALPKDICPEAKVTDGLASDPTLRLHPIVCAFDETQVMFEHAQHGSEFETLVTDLVKRGPAVGIMVWLATQRPDAKSIPTGISSNAVLRLCLKVMSHVENDMVLGSGAYKNGIRATMFSRKDVGLAILAGDGSDPIIVRASYIDGPAAELVAERAHAARAKAGRVTGVAAGHEDVDTDRGNVIDHLLEVWPADDPDWPTGKVWCDELATRLAAARPSTYGGWTGENVTGAVRPHGPRTLQVKRQGTNRRGLNRQDLVDALKPLPPR